MSSLQSIQLSISEYFASLPRRTVVVIVLILIFGVLLGVFGFLNANSSRGDQLSSESSSSVNPAAVRYDDDSLFTKIASRPHSSEFIVFTSDQDSKGNSKYFYQKPDAGITKLDALFETDGPFLQDSQYLLSSDELILNEGTGSYIFNSLSGKTIPVITPSGESTMSIAPIYNTVNNIQIDGFYYLTKPDKNSPTLDINRTTKLDFEGASKVLSFDPSQLSAKYDRTEIRVLNGQPFVFGYQLGDEQNLDIYRITKEKLVPKISLFDFDGIVFGGNKRIFYTVRKPETNDLGRYNHGLIDFSNTLNPTKNYFEFTREPRLDNILGEVIATRCNFDATEENIYCPIKVKDVVRFAANQPDEIIKYNIQSSTISYPYRNIGVSIGRIFFDRENNVYFISQNDQSFFKVKK
jgi:hypothetical protein